MENTPTLQCLIDLIFNIHWKKIRLKFGFMLEKMRQKFEKKITSKSKHAIR